MVRLPLGLEHALLGFVHERPMHAYEIYRQLGQARALGLVWHLKQSQLYALLARLEAAGYVDSATEPGEDAPPRKVLRLTPAGRDAFARWLVAPVAHGRDFRLEFLAKLFFADRHGPETVDELIAAQRQTCRAGLADLRAQLETAGVERPYDALVLRFRIGQLEAILGWLDICAATLVDAV